MTDHNALAPRSNPSPTGDPTTWPAQVETIQATEHARAMRDIDAAEQRARLDVS